MVIRAAFGLKTAGRDFRNHLRDFMSHIGFSPGLSYPNLWIREVEFEGGTIWEYLLLYVYDCLCISQNGHEILSKLEKVYELKPGAVGPPKIYLGGKLSKILLTNNKVAHMFGSYQYVKEAVRQE